MDQGKWSSLIYNTSARHKRHECDTNATRVRYECYTNDTSATWVKNFDFDDYTSKNIFSHPYIYYMASERLSGEVQFHSKNYLLGMSFFHPKMHLKGKYVHLRSFAWKPDCPISSKLQTSWIWPRHSTKLL